MSDPSMYLQVDQFHFISFGQTTKSFPDLTPMSIPFTNSLVYVFPIVRYVALPVYDLPQLLKYLGTGVGAGGIFALSASSSREMPAYFFRSASVKLGFFLRPSWPVNRPISEDRRDVDLACCVRQVGSLDGVGDLATNLLFVGCWLGFRLGFVVFGVVGF